MKKYFFFLIVTFSINGQNANQIIDNLKKELSTHPDVKRTASIYSDLTWYFSTVSTDSAIHYGNKALQESKKLGDSTLIAQVYSDIGAVYFRKGDFQNSKENYLKAYTIRKARKDYKGLAKINNNLANIYEKNQQYKEAMSSYLEALQYFEDINDEKNSNTIRGNIGLILLKIKNFSKSLSYISKVVEYQEKNNLNEELCVSYLNLGNVYLQMTDTINALRFYHKSLKSCTLVGNKKGISSGYNNIGAIKTEQKKSKDALALYQKSMQARKELNSDLDKANFDLNLAKEYLTANRLKEAKSLLLQTQKVFEKVSSNSNLQVNYKALIVVSAKLNQPDSVSFYIDKLAILNEQLIESKATKLAAELETKYQTEKKEQLLRQKEAEAKQKNILLIGISSLLALIVVIAFLIYRQQRLKNRQQEQEFQLKSAIAQIEKQNELQEQRLSISRDLHDNIGAQLTFIISSVENIKYAFDITNEKLDTKLQGISAFARSTILELRDTIWAMNNNEIHFEDLRVRILDFIEKAKIVKENIDFKFTIEDSVHQEKLSSISGMNIYRTIQEAVNNAIKYADASLITIDVKTIDGKIAIHIQDNGKGFDEETVEKGNGLLNMQKRIEDIGGVFNLVTAPEEGTAIELLLHKEMKL